MGKRAVVKHAMLTYTDEAGSRRNALRGRTVELTAEEFDRLERLDAVVAEDDEAAAGITGASPVVAPATPDEVLARGEQADDAGSDEQQGETTETVDAAADGTEPPAESSTPTRSSSSRRRSSSSSG